MLSDIEKLTITVSAHELDSYRSVEQRARQQWAQLLADRGEPWRHAGLHLVDSERDINLVDHLTYRFEGTAVAFTSGLRTKAGNARARLVRLLGNSPAATYGTNP